MSCLTDLKLTNVVFVGTKDRSSYQHVPCLIYQEQVRPSEPQGAPGHHDDAPQDGEHLGGGG